MDKQKQIEKIEKVLLDRIVNKTWRASKIAKELYEMIIPENAVVLTREEYEQLAIGYKRWEKLAIEDMLTQAEKQTAEKLLDEIDHESNGKTKSITDLLRKKYGV